MGPIETCLSHITQNCPNPSTNKGPRCQTDDRNRECPFYTPATIRTVEAMDYSGQTLPQ